MLLLAAVGPVWLLVLAASAYGFVFGGVELIVLAVFIDAFFMTSTASVPLYTVGCVVLLSLLELAKPFTFLHQQKQ